MRPHLHQNRHSDNGPWRQSAAVGPAGAEEICAFWGNLFAGIKLALWLPTREQGFDARGRATLLLWLALALVIVIGEYLVTRPVAGLSEWGVTATLARFFVTVLVIHFAVAAVGLRSVASKAVVRIVPSLMIAAVLSYAAWSYLPPLYAAVPDWAMVIYLGNYALLLLIPALAVMRTVWRLPSGSARRGIAAGCIFAIATVAAYRHLSNGTIFEADTSHLVAESGAEVERFRVDVVGVYYAQPDLLQEAFADLRPGVPGEVELFAIVAGAYPNERAFMREVAAMGNIIGERFDAEGRVVRLLNSTAAPERHPLANGRNMMAAAEALADVMDPEDVLLFVVTSHGYPETISTGMTFPIGDLGVDAIDGVLKVRGDGPVIAVISACYSGSFVPGLEAPGRLIITAAAADRTSFGCSDDREWTYFGEALFDRALRETGDWRAAFEKARGLVTEWEEADALTPSSPQISVGADIGPALDALAERHGGTVAAR